MAFSLWLEPPTSAASGRVLQEIERLAGEHQAPRFLPHVTLLGGIQLPESAARDRTARLADSLRPYTLEGEAVVSGTSVFQCVFVRVRQDPPVMEAAQQARQAFDMPPAPYMPHLSLLYADLDEGCSAQVASAAHERLFGQQLEGARPCSFPATRISLWSTPPDGDVAAWRRVAVFPLRGAAGDAGSAGKSKR